MEPVTVYVHGTDPISQAGVVSQLRLRPEVRVVGELEVDAARMAVVVADQLDEATARVIRAIRGERTMQVLLVAAHIDEQTVVAAAEAGVSGLLRRADASLDTLVTSILRVADGHGEVPADLLGRLMDQLGRLQRQVLAPRGMTFAGLSPREADVLRLVAQGYDTAAIAAQLCYSERTIKNVLHDLNTRLQLRNRAHAVAYAVREGLI